MNYLRIHSFFILLDRWSATFRLLSSITRSTLFTYNFLFSLPTSVVVGPFSCQRRQYSRRHHTSAQRPWVLGLWRHTPLRSGASHVIHKLATHIFLSDNYGRSMHTTIGGWDSCGEVLLELISSSRLSPNGIHSFLCAFMPSSGKKNVFSSSSFQRPFSRITSRWQGSFVRSEFRPVTLYWRLRYLTDTSIETVFFLHPVTTLLTFALTCVLVLAWFVSIWFRFSVSDSTTYFR